jgi:hypothetical protein
MSDCEITPRATYPTPGEAQCGNAWLLQHQASKFETADREGHHEQAAGDYEQVALRLSRGRGLGEMSHDEGRQNTEGCRDAESTQMPASDAAGLPLESLPVRFDLNVVGFHARVLTPVAESRGWFRGLLSFHLSSGREMSHPLS